MSTLFGIVLLLAVLLGYLATAALVRRGRHVALAVPVGFAASVLAMIVVLGVWAVFLYAQLMTFLDTNLPALTERLIDAVAVLRQKLGQI